jgi:hypothetical protein
MASIRRRPRLPAATFALAVLVSVYIGCSQRGDSGDTVTSATGSGGSGGSAEPIGPAGSGGTYGFSLCAFREDCPLDTACERYECADVGVCVLTYALEGKVVNLSPSDCTSVLCGANGQIQSTELENGEIPPDDLNDCTDDTCLNGSAAYMPKADGAPCGDGTKQCKAGQCAVVACQAVSDCPEPPVCMTGACDSGACAYSPSPAGTMVTDMSPSDCTQTVCDGAGSEVAAEDLDDTPTDDKPCTDDVCVGETPTFTLKADGEDCGGGMYCDSGVCSQCGVDANCQDPCVTNQQCFFGECKFGSNKPNGTSCNGSMFCFSGACSQCGVAANCPPPGACKAVQCALGACEYSNLPNGTNCGLLKSCQNGQCV